MVCSTGHNSPFRVREREIYENFKVDFVFPEKRRTFEGDERNTKNSGKQANKTTPASQVAWLQLCVCSQQSPVSPMELLNSIPVLQQEPGYFQR